jgi:putative component of membrane protein insertase Oxa1/YidC/SpoIIIJ protein YidD
MSKKHRIAERHKYTVIEPLVEVYPETNRRIIRPKLPVRKLLVLSLLCLVCVAGLSAAVVWGIFYLDTENKITAGWGLCYFLTFIALALLCLVVFAKKIVIFLIRVYQRFGPYEIRSKCLFVPNCSEYMILAIKKYGLFRGIKMGKDRFYRCCPPNGGEDYP